MVFKVLGGSRICGETVASGSKNAALPVLFATLLTDGVSTVRRVPDITDVAVAVRLIGTYGAVVRRTGDVLTVDTRKLHDADPDPCLLSKIRGSSYLLGAALARFSRVKIPQVGGCAFDTRPIDLHLFALARLGARQDGDLLTCPRLRGAEIPFPKISVGASVNALLAASSAEGESRILNAASEPHIDSLIAFLRSAGAEIVRERDGVVRVCPGRLHGGEVTLCADTVEAGTYLVGGALTGGDVTVHRLPPEEIRAPLAVLSAVGCRVECGDGFVRVSGAPCVRGEVTTAPYPGFPTDLAPVFAPLFALCGGSVTETVWKNRFGYLSGLSSFGVRSVREGQTAEILPSRFRPATAKAPDLRGGASLLLAALAAEGESRVGDGELLLRGYEHLTEKFSALGAHIRSEP